MPTFSSRLPLIALSSVVVVASTVCLTALPGRAQINVLPAFVRLQATTPGTAQSGHSNITGTARAGQFIGGGAGLIGVNADLLDGLNSTAFLQSVPNPLVLSGSNALVSTIKATNTSNSAGSTGVYGAATGTTAFVNGVWGTTTSQNGHGVYGTASGSDSSAGYFENTGFNGFGLYALSPNYGIHAETTNDFGDAFAVAGISNSNSDFYPGIGVYGESHNERGAGVYGRNYSSTVGGYGGYGGYFYSANPGGAGVHGEGHTGMSGFGQETGGSFGTDSETGTGIFGFGYSLTGNNVGGEFGSNSPTGRGVYGSMNANTGVNYAGRFEVDSVDGRAVYGVAFATGANDTPYGVRGQCSTATSGYAVYAVGDSGASGLKSFRIDHPTDPENKYLLHYSSESPFPQNFYSGNVKTDASGYAWVQLPDYFQSINTNVKYQLTVVGKTFAQAIVSEEVSGNRFQIRTNQPGIKVSWRIEADRNDLRVQRNRPTDVREKTGAERGTYQQPEYYNLPASKGLDYDPKRPERRQQPVHP